MADERKQAGGNAWGDGISRECKAELEEWLQAWANEADHGKKRGAFDGITLTGADVFWLAARSLAGRGDESSISTATTRLTNGRFVPTLPELHLEGADLKMAHLEKADLIWAHLEGANLFFANLERAYLLRAHLEQANLQGAHLEGATL